MSPRSHGTEHDETAASVVGSPAQRGAADDDGASRLALGGSAVSAWRRFRDGLEDGLPFPLWTQGALEALQACVLGLLVVALPVLCAYLGGAWGDMNLRGVWAMTGQGWLAAHGVPLVRATEGDVAGGIMWWMPLALSALGFWLFWRAGRRIARASWSNQLWQGVGGAAIATMGVGVIVALTTDTGSVHAPWAAGAFVPLILTAGAMIAGARREAGSFGRLIGFDAAEWVRDASQYSRWAGSYAWAVVRAGFIAFVAALGVAAVALVIRLAVSWQDGVNAALQISPGVLGGIVLFLAQLVFLPNAVLFSLSWISGAGFSVGEGTLVSPFVAQTGPLPTLPFVAILPTDLVGAWWVLMLPVVAGILAGWWFLREGENHLEEWFLLRVPQRWLALTLATLALGLAVGLVAAACVLGATALAGGSLGLGYLTDIGPLVWASGGLVGLQIAVGTMIGYLLAPLFERDPVLDA